MKMINAYIQKFMCEKVTDALREAHIHGITVVECSGFGRQSEEESHRYLDKTVRAGFGPKTKLEIVCTNEEVDAIIKIIREAAHTGKYGDGKIFVSDIHTAVDIRTGVSGDEVL